MEHIGILGGTFDPVTEGHLYIARTVGSMLGLDRVLLVTAGNPPHKVRNVLDAELRHEMVEVAVHGNTGLEASRLELDHGVSYTIDAVKALLKSLPGGGIGTKISFITSAEYLNPENPSNIRTWKGVDELLTLINLVVTPRGWMTSDVAEKWAEELNITNVQIVDVPVYSVSSGMVKDALRDGQEIDTMVPRAVADLIKTRGYYR
jgi:nicotinate-nucleotide adenylyltransferase